jgi:phosphate transport system permease protein
MGSESASRPRARRGPDDPLLFVGTGACALLIVVLVTAIGATLYADSHLARQKFGLSFWTGSQWNPVSGVFGALPFIWGTLYSSLLALLIGAPVALGIAIFLSELCPRRLRLPLVFLTELLAAIPSIVYGLWGLTAIVPLVRRAQLALPAWLRAVPLLSGPPVGVSMAAAALVLAVMIVPFTASVAREVLRAVPMAQREAAYALGATQWEAIRMALGWGRTGIVGAIMLGLARALGETIAVTMVIGNSPQIALSVFAPQHTMAAVIANEFTEATGDLYLHALVEIGFVLFVITVLINVLSRLLIWGVSEAPARRVSSAREPATAQGAPA